ncbi:MAG: hypothetical protein QXP04_04195 [Candidatus Nanoarchaeia archaeon]|nr:hypothetical protein [Candidatus Jingweiarchaeum tengchongense]
MKKKTIKKKRTSKKTKSEQLTGKGKFKKIELKLLADEIDKIEKLRNTLMFTDVQEFIRTAIKEKISKEEEKIKKMVEPKPMLSEKEIQERIAEEKELMQKYSDQLMKYALRILREKYEDELGKFKSSMGELFTAESIGKMNFREFVESNLLLSTKENFETSG